MFGCLKRTLKDYEFAKIVKGRQKKVTLAYEVMKTMFQIDKFAFEGFFKKTLNNMVHFWLKLDYKKLQKDIEDLN